MQTENLLVLLKCAQIHDKTKFKNIGIKYRERDRNKSYFYYKFLLYNWGIKMQNKTV